MPIVSGPALVAELAKVGTAADKLRQAARDAIPATPTSEPAATPPATGPATPARKV